MVMKISEGAEADIYLVDLLGIKCIMKYRRKKIICRQR